MSGTSVPRRFVPHSPPTRVERAAAWEALKNSPLLRLPVPNARDVELLLTDYRPIEARVIGWDLGIRPDQHDLIERLSR